MADTKISALPAATTPLAGTEVLPIVQSSVTVKVSVDNLTVKNIRSNATNGILQIAGPAVAATRVMTTPDANFTVARTDAAQSFTGNQTLSTGNLVIGTSGQGIDFSATPGTGTSELLADYEEGTWTPIIVGSSTAGAGTYTVQVGTYTKIGNSVFVQMFLIWTAHTGTGDMKVGGLPFTTSATFLNFSAASIGQFENIALTIGSTPMAIIATSGTTIDLRQMPTGGGAMANVPMDSSGGIILTAAYKV